MHPDAPRNKKGESLLYVSCEQRRGLDEEVRVLLLRAGANPMLTPPGGACALGFIFSVCVCVLFVCVCLCVFVCVCVCVFVSVCVNVPLTGLFFRQTKAPGGCSGAPRPALAPRLFPR